jgi:putative DNA primase/helicase
MSSKSDSQQKRQPPNYDAGLPAAEEAERMLFGLVLIGTLQFGEMAATLRFDDLVTETHQRIFRGMAALDERGVQIDIVTLSEQLENVRQLSAVGGRAYLASLTEGMPPVPHPERYIRMVRDASLLRQGIHTADAIANRFLNRDADVGELLASSVAAFQSIQSRNGHPAADTAGWPEPLPIGSELPPVQPFDPEMLPEQLRAYVEDIAERMQVPLDYPAACLMVAIAGAINRRANIQPKAGDNSWIVIPNLWGSIIAPPGFLKSPVLQTICAPLYAREKLWRMEWEQDVESYEAEKESLDIRMSAWREQAKAGLKKGSCSMPIRPDASIKQPTLKRLITGDSTFEKLHELLQENPAGLLVIRDELTGWLAELDREGRQGERAFFLSAWNGDTPFTIDRIGRGSVQVPACCVSMLGAITPARLQSYLPDALVDGPSNDGLIQRFQVQVWPDPPRAWRYIDRPPARNQIVAGLFERIFNWDSDLPAAFRFGAEAQEFFRDWLGDLEHKIRSDELNPALISHLAKYRKLMPALALILATADQLLMQGQLYDPPMACLHSAKQAARWCAYLESHARRIYACVVTPTMHAAADLATKLKAKAVGADGTFAVRDVYRHCWSRLDTPERVIAALNVLEDACWVQSVRNDSRPGRPPNLYFVNPRLRQTGGSHL